MKIDAHQHFWQYDPEQYPWIPKGSALHRTWLPADLAALQAPLGLAGSVAVQARQSLAETDWLLSLADNDPIIKAVVGWVDLRSPDLRADLERLTRHPKFTGVRHVVQDEPDDHFLTRPEFTAGIAQLQEFRLTYDLLIFPHQLPAAIQLAQKFPAQPFVLDHIAKPSIKSETISPWRDQIRQLAACPNVHCKLSGIITEADHLAWKAADIRPYLDIIFDAFGPARLMWGSDWPVCLLAGTYEQTYRLIRDYSGQDHDNIFGETCAQFYNITTDH